jgi:hypothetical protein
MHFLLRYMCNSGFFKARFKNVCVCGANPNSRTHITNECPLLQQERTKCVDAFNAVILDGESLEECFMRSYFLPGNDSKRRKQIIQIMNSFITAIFVNKELKRSLVNVIDDSM